MVKESVWVSFGIVYEGWRGCEPRCCSCAAGGCGREARVDLEWLIAVYRTSAENDLTRLGHGYEMVKESMTFSRLVIVLRRLIFLRRGLFLSH